MGSLNYPKTKTSLQYFQDMFDLYEVYARQLKRSFTKTKLGLDPDQMFHKLYNDKVTQLCDRCKQMMQETKMGTDSAVVNGVHKYKQNSRNSRILKPLVIRKGGCFNSRPFCKFKFGINLH